ncbi:unnamed protein product [Cylicostephanus goldi]|uniref:Uncharacterized protein n=1 Tax=Cylicostephanus goldi TaxID=71465 RepID=A0A3P7N267_CYLGO|nr:unnamed protein product [Cylicostephanus goldi]
MVLQKVHGVRILDLRTYAGASLPVRCFWFDIGKRSRPKTPPYEPHVSSDGHTSGPDKEETSALPAPNNAVPHKTSLLHAPPLGIPLPAPQTLAAVSPTPLVSKEDKNHVVEVAQQRKGVENGHNGSVGM